MSKKLTVVFILLICSNISMAQSPFSWFSTRKAVKSLKVAQQLINESKYEEARDQLLETIEIKKDFAITYRELGNVYLMLQEYEKAIENYEQSFELNSKISRAAYFECGECYFKIGQFEKANEYYTKFEALAGSRYTNQKKEKKLEEKHREFLPIRKRNYLFAIEAIKKPTSDLPKNLGNQINSEEEEYLPTISGNGKVMIFTTKRTYSPIDAPTGENIYQSYLLDDEWTQAQSISATLNTPKNEGMAKFSANETYMYFAGCERPEGYGGCDIYEATLNDFFRVENVKILKGGVNSEVWDSQPSISCDGRIMFFTSNREGGKGGADIYMSVLGSDSVWTEPTNMPFNTFGDEQSPYIAPDGKTLYFASTGLDGMGDSDLFMTQFINSDTFVGWSEPMNLGYPINSPFEEVGLFLKPDGYTAYFASSRTEGFGKLDIYEVELEKDFQPQETVLLEGRVTDDLTGQPLKNTTVTISRNKEKWILETNKDGWYFLCLPAAKAYAFQVNESDYEYFMEAAFLAAQDNHIPFRFDISLIRKFLPSKNKDDNEDSEMHINVYFDLDSYALTDKTIAQLNELSSKLLKEPNWEIEVIGYTDNLGNSAYNKLLSEQRARAVVAHLGKRGVIVEKVRREGRGVDNAANGSEEDRIKGRRVEVILRKV